MNARHKAKRVYLLSGIIYCGECGSPMSGNARRSGRNKTEYVTYDCNRRHRERTCKAKAINKEYVEELVLKYLIQEFFVEENIRSLAQKLLSFQQQRKNESQPELIALKKELSDKEKELKNIIESIKKGGYKSWMGDLGDELDDRIKYLKGKIEYLENIEDQVSLTEDDIYNYIMKDSDLSDKSPEDLKQIVQTYVEKVVVFEETIEIHLIINNHNSGGSNRPNCGYDGGDDGTRTHVRKHFHRNFSERSFCFKASPFITPKSRLYNRLSRCSLMLPGFHIRFSCMVDARFPAYR